MENKAADNYGTENTATVSQDRIAQIYDSTFKKILTLSARAVIGLINGLFDTNYPIDSTITYNWTESHDDDLKRTIADAILTINNEHSYHMEAQMYKDEEIELRVFDYGYHHALKRSSDGGMVLKFPEPRIIQLYKHERMPDEKIIILDFGIQGRFEHRIPVFKLLEHSLEDLNQRRMVILLPFMLLKLRDSLRKERTEENIEALRKLILDDIIGMINENQSAGYITASDANRLRGLIRKLYNHLYAHYRELAEGGLNDMLDEDLVLEVDIIEEEVTRRVTKEVTERVTKEVTERVTKQVTGRVTEQVTSDLTKRISEALNIPLETIQKAL